MPPGAYDTQGILRQGPGILGGGVGPGQAVRVEVPAGGEGVCQLPRRQKGGADIVHVFHSGGRLHHQLGQSIAIVGVDAVGARLGLEPLRGEAPEQRIGGLWIGIVKEKGIAGAVPHQAGGMVQEHPHRDALIPLVCHAELRQDLRHRRLQRQGPPFTELQHRCGRIRLGHRAHTVENILGKRPVFTAGIDSPAALERDLSPLPEGVADAVRASILRRKPDGVPAASSRVLIRASSAARAGAERAAASSSPARTADRVC